MNEKYVKHAFCAIRGKWFLIRFYTFDLIERVQGASQRRVVARVVFNGESRFVFYTSCARLVRYVMAILGLRQSRRRDSGAE